LNFEEMFKNILVLVVLLGSIGFSHGWGEDGHKMIAKIASDMLTDTATNIVSQMIGSKTLSDIAPIPDEYDHTPQGNWSEPCHFCNLPKGATNFTMEYCPHLCVVKAIMNYTQILSEEQANPTMCSFESGAEPCALIFLVHYVGDVHQPLHVGFGYDLGGNTVPVSFYGTATNLHHVWDTNIIEKWTSYWEDGATELEEMASNETDTVKYYESVPSPIDWADESFHYVLNTCYNYTDDGETTKGIKMRGISPARLSEREVNDKLYRMRLVTETPYLGDKYYDTNLPIIQQRLIAAGVRLGTLLNNILTGF
jgi:hypothetical protein